MNKTEIFIEKSKKIHGNKYDYSKVNYISCGEKVCIICPEHGEFWQTPHSNLNRHGCPLCGSRGNNYKSSKFFFVERSKKKYGNKYDYSKVEYVNSNTKVCIICPEHGEFWITPHSHLNGVECKICKKNVKNSKKKLTTDDFIKKAKQIHGDKYDYSKVKYVNNHTKVCIICPEHGEFWQLPSSHLSKRGCNLCSKPMHNKETFIERAKKIHGDKYDYSKVEYVDSITKVCIICPEHGEFWQTPSNHLSGKKCKLCHLEMVKEKKKSNTIEFVKKAKEVHGNRYDYSKVNYINSNTKVCIICPEHGEFLQTPNKHLTGENCPLCNISNLEYEVKKLLEELKINYIKEFTPKWSDKKRYDFCIPDKKILIECQGEQHYFPVDFFNKKDGSDIEEFKKRVEYDLLKKELAEKNGFKLLYYTKPNLKKENEIIDINDLKNIIINEQIKNND